MNNKMKKLKTLDCTIRDGGYYTLWDFENHIIDDYITNINLLPIDYIEIGYRSVPLKNYLGKYFYSPKYEILDIKNKTNKKLVVILNEKDTRLEHLESLLKPIVGLVDMVRIALDPQHLGRAIKLAEGIKKYGFEVGFNVMYMSKWQQYGDFILDLKSVDGIADYFYMVDSYGGVYPQDVIETIDLVRSNTNCALGFHGHNNLELALINTLTAIEHGVEIVDSTILGMGRGAGNLKTELLLSVLNTKFNVDVDYNAIGNIVSSFNTLLDKHQWGTNLPYMISGSNSLPQKDVMEWVTTRYYSFNSIIRALSNQKAKLEDNERFSSVRIESSKTVLIIGGGPGASAHSKAIAEFVSSGQDDITLIHASSKNAQYYKGLRVRQVFCLVGSEGHRLEKVFDDLGDFDGIAVLPPYPRKMGTYVPNRIKDKTFELAGVTFTDLYKDSHTALALQTALAAGAEQVYVAGYDGYQEGIASQKERNLILENEYLFEKFRTYTNIQIVSINNSNYRKLHIQSVYGINT